MLHSLNCSALLPNHAQLLWYLVSWCITSYHTLQEKCQTISIAQICCPNIPAKHSASDISAWMSKVHQVVSHHTKNNQCYTISNAQVSMLDNLNCSGLLSQCFQPHTGCKETHFLSPFFVKFRFAPKRYGDTRTFSNKMWQADNIELNVQDHKGS